MRVWSTFSGVLVAELSGDEIVYKLEASSDRTRFAVGGSKSVRILDANGAEQRRIPTKSSCVALAFSPDGQRLAYVVARERVIRVIDVATGRVEAEMTPEMAPARVLAFSRDGRELLAACRTQGEAAPPYNCLTLWRLDAPDVRLWRKRIVSRASCSVAVPGGFVVGDSGGMLAIYDRVLAGARLLRAKPDSGYRSDLAHDGSLSDVCVGPSGRILYSISRDAKGGGRGRSDVRAWNIAEGRLINTFALPAGGRQTTVDVSPDGLLVLFGSNASGRVEVRLAAGIRGETDD